MFAAHHHFIGGNKPGHSVIDLHAGGFQQRHRLAAIRRPLRQFADFCRHAADIDSCAYRQAPFFGLPDPVHFFGCREQCLGRNAAAPGAFPANSLFFHQSHRNPHAGCAHRRDDACRAAT